MRQPEIEDPKIGENERDEDARWRLNWAIGQWFGWTFDSKATNWRNPQGQLADLPDYVGALGPDGSLADVSGLRAAIREHERTKNRDCGNKPGITKHDYNLWEVIGRVFSR